MPSIFTRDYISDEYNKEVVDVYIYWQPFIEYWANSHEILLWIATYYCKIWCLQRSFSITGEARLFTDTEMATLHRLLVSPDTLDTPRELNASPTDRVSDSDGNRTECQQQDTQSVKNDELVYQRLRQMLNTNSWTEDEDLSAFLEKPFMRLCAHYLYNEKRRSYALDSVGELPLLDHGCVCFLEKKIIYSNLQLCVASLEGINYFKILAVSGITG